MGYTDKKFERRTHYPWWGYVKAIVRQYPDRCRSMAWQGTVSQREKEAVAAAVEYTSQMDDGQNRLKLIRLLHWDKTHTLEGAALDVSVSRRTAAYWQREFFETVARNRGLLG